MSDLISDSVQPMPAGTGEPVVPRLIELIQARRDQGVRTYGRELATFDGRDTNRDLVEELVDATKYALKDRMEREELLNRISRQAREIARLKKIIAQGGR
ncbi:MAG TPA: hypothetical protein VEI97_01785 [bacterium]|nr:hypothetical protein [bacterium]